MILWPSPWSKAMGITVNKIPSFKKKVSYQDDTLKLKSLPKYNVWDGFYFTNWS